MLSPKIIDQNPWWGNPNAIASDRDLAALERSPLRFKPEIPMTFDQDAIHVLRGPRQVGKTTLLKRIAEMLLRGQAVQPRQLLYLDVERMGVLDYPSLQDVLGVYVAWARQPDLGRRLVLLLDEVTGVPRWSTALKALYAMGALDHVTVLATGSDILDLERGGDRLPGRRGEVANTDWVLLPWSFLDYVAVHDPDLADALPVVPLDQPRQAFHAAQEIALHGSRIQDLFTRYLHTGGFPQAAQAFEREGLVPEHVYRLHEAALLGELRRAGRDEARVREIFTQLVGKHLGREFSWQGLAAATSIGSHSTARSYVEDLERTFVWHVWHRVKSPHRAAVALRSPKKLYPIDPFYWHVMEGWAHGIVDRWSTTLSTVAEPGRAGYLVESVIASLLRRRAGPFAFYYRDRKGSGEVDFVAFRDARLLCRIEAKWSSDVRRKDVRPLVRAGGGIVASRQQLEWWEEENIAVIPAAFLAAGFGAGLTLFPTPPG